MLNDRSTMLFNEEHLFEEYKKLYKDDILYSNWEEIVKGEVGHLSTVQISDVIKGFEIKRDRNLGKDNLNDVIFLVVVPIGLCLINIIQNLFGRVELMEQVLFTKSASDMELQSLSSIVADVTNMMVQSELHITCTALVVFLGYLLVCIMVKSHIDKNRIRRKSYYSNMISVLRKIQGKSEGTINQPHETMR